MAKCMLSHKPNDPLVEPNPNQHALLHQYEPHLKSLAQQMGNVFLQGVENMSWLIQHASADFQGIHDLSSGIMTMVEYIQLAQTLNAAHPKCRSLEVLEDWVEWEVHGGTEGAGGELRAAVWQFARVVIDCGTVRDGLRLSRWKRRPEGVWLCYHYALWRCDPVASGQMTSYL